MAIKHLGWERIPLDAAELPVLAYVRNPWDWYVSWYHFNLVVRNGQDPHFKAISAGSSLDFATIVRKACTFSEPPVEGDLYSFCIKFIVGPGLDSESTTLGRYESLSDDLERFLGDVGVELPEGAMTRIRAKSPIQASDHEPYRQYYDDDLRDLVGESSRMFIDRFGYEF